MAGGSFFSLAGRAINGFKTAKKFEDTKISSISYRAQLTCYVIT